MKYSQPKNGRGRLIDMLILKAVLQGQPIYIDMVELTPPVFSSQSIIFVNASTNLQFSVSVRLAIRI